MIKNAPLCPKTSRFDFFFNFSFSSTSMNEWKKDVISMQLL
jgi:hypothetical protein